MTYQKEEVRLTMEDAIRLIQVHERARQGRLRAKFMREIRMQEEREKMAATRGAPTMDPDVAAVHIQRVILLHVPECIILLPHTDTLVYTMDKDTLTCTHAHCTDISLYMHGHICTDLSTCMHIAHIHSHTSRCMGVFNGHSSMYVQHLHTLTHTYTLLHYHMHST